VLDAKKLHVVVVDDSTPVRETLVLVLELQGIATIGLATAEAAIAHITGHPTDVLLCDIQLPGPGVNGIQAALEIAKVAPDCRVLLMSGDSTSSVLLDGARKSGHEFEVIAKPFGPEELFAILNKTASP